MDESTDLGDYGVEEEEVEETAEQEPSPQGDSLETSKNTSLCRLANGNVCRHMLYSCSSKKAWVLPEEGKSTNQTIAFYSKFFWTSSVALFMVY